MKPLLKSLVLAPGAKKWAAYQNHFAPVFAGKDPTYDRIVGTMEDFFRRFSMVPNYEALTRELTLVNDNTAITYLNQVLSDVGVPIHTDDAVFVAAADTWKVANFDNDVAESTRRFQASLAGQAVGLPQRRTAYEKLLGDLHVAKNRLDYTEAGTKLLLYGEAAVQRLATRYESVVAKNNRAEAIYYALPFPSFPDVLLKPGDLFFTGAFTTQGKSIMLRHLSYHLATTYGLNVEFVTFEMTAQVVEDTFSIMHANAMAARGLGPRILFSAYKKGELTAEQKDFLINVAQRDLTSNPAYGTIRVQKPGKSDFNIDDMQDLITEAEWTMPVHVLAVDYLPQMSATRRGAKASMNVSAAKNVMIADFKQILLNHRDRKGVESPILGLTAAQISRTIYRETRAKKDGIYDLDAFSDYNEIERSADVAMTTWMDAKMRANCEMRAQVLKNRDGMVPDMPVMLNCHLAHGMGLMEAGIAEMTGQRATDTLISLGI